MMSHKKTKPTVDLAEMIATEVMRDCEGEEVVRLQFRGKDEKDLGGLCRQEVLHRIRRVLCQHPTHKPTETVRTVPVTRIAELITEFRMHSFLTSRLSEATEIDTRRSALNAIESAWYCAAELLEHKLNESLKG